MFYEIVLIALQWMVNVMVTPSVKTKSTPVTTLMCRRSCRGMCVLWHQHDQVLDPRENVKTT